VGLKPLGALADTNRLRLALGLPLRHQAELAALLRDIYDPAGTNFHRYLSPAQFAARFGPTAEDYGAVAAFAQSHGWRVVRAHANRLLLDVEGPVSAARDAFHVNMNVFRHPSGRRAFFAPRNEPSVEAGVPLAHIAGLDDYLLPEPQVVTSARNPVAANTGSGPGGAYMGRDFRAAYLPGVALDGAGQTVALVEFDTFHTNDILNYENMAGLPNVPVTAVPVDGFNAPPSDSGGNDEVSADIELTISMAPGLSQVLVYEASYIVPSVSDDLLNQIAEDDLANQIACCWFYTIDSTTDSIFQEMAAQGQSFFCASGDTGAYYPDPSPLVSDPNITIVGGTTLTTTGPGGSWMAETVWNWFTTGQYPLAAGSGGVSATYAIPYWQQSVNMSSNGGSTAFRNLPDVALTADNIVLISRNGQLNFGGGTSCATPLWAGLTAMVNQQAARNGRPSVGFLNPALYGLGQGALYPSLFHDITTGNNTNSNGSTKFFATPGYDLCTGWGTPNGQALINALAPPDNLVLLPLAGASFTATNSVALAGWTQSLALKNTDGSVTDWTLSPPPKWLTLSATNGVVAPGQAAVVTLSLTSGATNLPAGSYTAALLLTNLTDGVTHPFPVFLRVADPLMIAPESGMAVAGPVGGPFNPAIQTFVLENAAATPLSWSAQSGSPLVSFLPGGGTLPVGGSVPVFAFLGGAASNLLISAQSATLSFADLTTGTTETQSFTLAVGNGGFETGDFSDWTLTGTDAATDNFVGSGIFVSDYIHSGAAAALLGEFGSTATLSQVLPTAAGRPYLLSFWLDNPVGGDPNQFAVKWGGSTLFAQTNLGQFLWTNLQYVVPAPAAATTLAFVFRNDPDAFGLDDVSVTAVSAPSFLAATISNGVPVLSWSAMPGFGYQLQYATDLGSPRWINSGAAMVATNGIVTAADPRPSDPRRFYRVELLPP
jgi:hypothetical protein